MQRRITSWNVIFPFRNNSGNTYIKRVIGLPGETVRIDNDGVEEIILALKPSIEGETTMQYIKKILNKYDVRVSKIPIGIPLGTDIEYIDSMTLEMAFEDRKDIA